MQTTPSALTIPTIRVAQDGDCDTVSKCQELLDAANRRLLKTLADLDAAIAKGNASDAVIQQYRVLVDLYKEGMAIKDQFIADVQADNAFLRKQVHPSKSLLRKIFDRIEKYAILAAGIYIGKGL